jgi:hypothetical protein
MANQKSIRSFDPARVARLETENWEAYYQKRWLRLLQVSVGMVQEAFGLNTWQALRAAYLVGRAEIVAAPFPNNDIPRAEAYMRRFYDMIRRIHHEETFDVEQAARLEVNWWVVHRQLYLKEDLQPLVDALVDLYAATFRLPRESVQAAAFHRAEAMRYSDRWVNGSKASGDPLLAQVEAELNKSYTALRAAAEAGPAAVGVPVANRSG